MLLKSLTILIALLISVVQIYSQNIDEIINKSIEARGDIQSFKDMKTMRITGNLTQMGMKLPFTYITKGDKLFRMESEMMGSKNITCYNGDTLFREKQGQKQALPISDEKQLGQFRMIESFIKGPLVDYEEKDREIELSGSVKEDGRDAFTLKLIDDDDTESYLYIDKKDYECFKIWALIEGPNNQEMEIEVKFSNYTKVDGFSYPFDIALTVDGSTSGFIIDKIEFNIELDDSLFNVRKKVSKK